jgi:hypothetical protein
MRLSRVEGIVSILARRPAASGGFPVRERARLIDGGQRRLTPIRGAARVSPKPTDLGASIAEAFTTARPGED